MVLYKHYKKSILEMMERSAEIAKSTHLEYSADPPLVNTDISPQLVHSNHMAADGRDK